MEIDEYAMRDIEESDLPQLLEWRNSPEIHSKMLTDHIITWDEHMGWFLRIKEQNPMLNFAFTYQGQLAGYLGYTKYDEINKICDGGSYLGVALDLPVDAGIYLGNMLFNYAFEVLKVRKMISDIFIDNKRVIKINQLKGMKIVKKHAVEKDGEIKKVVRMEVQRADWIKCNVYR